jgi:hypothetical protein
MTVRRPIWLACAALVLAASCTRDDPPPPAGDAAEAGAPAVEPEPPRLTPAESTAAVAQQREAAQAKTREVRASVRALDPPPPAAPHVETPETIYQSCLAQARSVDEPVRSQLLEICERRRAGP